GIPLKTIWLIVWSVAGLVAIVAGIMWGAKSGVQFSLSLVALKALPVLILGGFTSVPGAIVGGLIVGVGEKLGEVYWGPLVGGAVRLSWCTVVQPGPPLYPKQGSRGAPPAPAPAPPRHRPARVGDPRVVFRARHGLGRSLGRACSLVLVRAIDVGLVGASW